MDIRSKLTSAGVAVLIFVRQCAGAVTQTMGGWLEDLPLPRLRPATERTRGDVPGWVLITLMSAVLVAGLLAIAGPALEKLFNEAMAQVKP